MKNICPLQSILEDDSKHKSFTSSIVNHLETHVQAMKSLKGLFIKKTYASVKAIRPGYVEHIIEILSKDYIHEFSGMHSDFMHSQTLPCDNPASFDSYVKSHFSEAEQHFWRIADDYAAKRSETLIGKAYKAARGTIASHLPQMLEIICTEIDKHTFYEV